MRHEARDLRNKAGVVADQGPKERWQHSGKALEATERAGILAVRATEENLLDVFVLRGFISGEQRDAGMRFRADYHASGLEARVVGSYDPSRSCSRSYNSYYEMSDAQEVAYMRWREAVRALGRTHCDLIISISCFDQWSRLTELPKVRHGLSVLIQHYGI